MLKLWNALRAGEVLTNPAAWKNRQNLINALVAILGAVLWILNKVGVGLELSGDEMASVAGGIAIVMGAINNYLTTATTDKIGVGKPVDPTNE